MALLATSLFSSIRGMHACAFSVSAVWHLILCYRQLQVVKTYTLNSMNRSQPHPHQLYQPQRPIVSVVDNILCLHCSTQECSVLFDIQMEGQEPIAQTGGAAFFPPQPKKAADGEEEGRTSNSTGTVDIYNGGCVHHTVYNLELWTKFFKAVCFIFLSFQSSALKVCLSFLSCLIYLSSPLLHIIAAMPFYIPIFC
jgi:hypothetical protein